jgi:microcystin-dependent protein
MFAGNFPPAGWASCNGQLMPISENDTLFTLIGTTYGGDGQETFGLPDLQGRTPMHVGNGHVLGEQGGTETVTLTTQQIPVHSHPIVVSKDQGTQKEPNGEILGSNPTVQLYRPGVGVQPMKSDACSVIGGSQPHENMQPYLVIQYIISLFGIFPHT